MLALAGILLCLLANQNSSKQLPRLSFSFFDPKHGIPREPEGGWIIARRDEPISFHALLEVGNADAPYEPLIFRDSKASDPLLVGSKHTKTCGFRFFAWIRPGAEPGWLCPY